MKPVYVSPSQISSYVRCPRLWFGEKIKKLPTLDRGYGHFGTVLHGVVQRWLEADDTGRNAITGKPVELYPTGWHLARNIFTREVEGSVDPAEQLQIRRLVEIAIEQGDLRRWPGRLCEVRMDREVIPGVRTWATIDVLLPDGITDHKSTKDMKYAKSKEELRGDLQLLFYAKEVIERDSTLQELIFTHIYYCKNPNSAVQVKSVPTLLHKTEIEDGWALIQSITRDMVRVRELGPEQPWFDVAGPVNYASACNAFGGCQFRPLCGRKESIPSYVDRVGRIRAAKQTTTTTPATESNKMSLFDEMMGESKNSTTATARPAAAAAKTAKPAAKTEMANGKIKVHESPPWGIDGCPACQGVGFSSKGDPCRICVGRSEKDGGPSPSSYTITVDRDGFMVWEEKEEAEAEEVVEEVVEQPKRGPGRPKKLDAPAPREAAPSNNGSRPTLYIGCLPVGVTTKDIGEIFESVSADLAASQKAESYYKLDTWERRESVARVASKVVQAIAAQHILCNSINPDVKNLVDALARHCIVVRGVLV